MAKPIKHHNVVSLSPILPPVESDSSWFAKLIERGRSGVFTETLDITPEMAKRFLENNPNNREPSRRYLEKITRDIVNDNWVFNGEPIIISVDGELNDGSHRLKACIRANKPIKSLVVFGLPRNTRMSVDTGRARRVNDFLHMQGKSYANNTAAASRTWLSYTKGYYNSKDFTHQDILNFYNANSALIDYAVHMGRSDKYYRSVGVTPVAVAYCIINKINSKLCDRFFDQFLSGANLLPDSPILFMRQHFMIAPEKKLSTENKVELILRYWNAWCSGTSLQKRIPLLQKYPIPVVVK